MYNHAMKLIREIKTPGGLTLRFVNGDITQSQVDAIVNAANTHLRHGGGVAGAIARAGGPSIQTESDAWIQEHGLITHESPALTTGGELPCNYVIHAVGPIWGAGDEVERLATTIKAALRIADENGIETLAIPAISTGIYGFPRALGAQVIIDALLEFDERKPDKSIKIIEITLIDDLSVTAFAAEFDQRWRDPA